jgi:hypothetical protein
VKTGRAAIKLLKAGNEAVAAESEMGLAAPAGAEPLPHGPARAACPDPSGIAFLAPGGQPPPCTVVDAHLVWERQLAKLASIDLSLVDEPTLEAVCDQIARLEGLILSTRARTLEGVMAQVRRVAASMAHNDGDAREQRGLHLALSTLARLRGA